MNAHAETDRPCAECGVRARLWPSYAPPVCEPCLDQRLDHRDRIRSQLRVLLPSLGARALTPIGWHVLVNSPERVLGLTATDVIRLIAELPDSAMLAWRNVGTKTLAEIRAAIRRQAEGSPGACPTCGRELAS